MTIYSPPWVYRKPKPQFKTQQSPPWFCAFCLTFCLSNTSLLFLCFLFIFAQSLHGFEISTSSFEFWFWQLLGVWFIFFFFLITVEGANVAAETVWGGIQRRLPHGIMCSPFFGVFWSSWMGVSSSTSWSIMDFKFRSWSCRRFNCWWNTETAVDSTNYTNVYLKNPFSQKILRKNDFLWFYVSWLNPKSK